MHLHMVRQKVRRMAPTALLLAATAVHEGAPVARADPYAIGYPTGGFEPDDKLHYTCFVHAFSAGFSDEFLDAVAFIEDNSGGIVHTYYVSCSDSRVDVIADQYLEGGDRGQYVCQTFNGSGECDVAAISLNADFFYSEYEGDMLGWQVRKTWCHELGHSLGLTHANDDCMVSGDSTVSTYSGHHGYHIENSIN